MKTPSPLPDVPSADANLNSNLFRKSAKVGLIVFGLLLVGLMAFLFLPRPGTAFTTESYIARLGDYPTGNGWNRRRGPTAMLSKKEVGEVYSILRERYPFESLDERMSFETSESFLGRPKSELDQSTLDRLDEAEKVRRNTDPRSRALEMLHSKEVKSFINRSGFGIERMAPVNPTNLTYDATSPSLAPVKLTEDYLADIPRPVDWKDEVGPENLNHFHMFNLGNFASGPQNGLVKKREQVAGFVPHVLKRQGSQEGMHEFNRGYTWKINRVELVSLLMNDLPVAYVSEKMPSMEDVDSAPTRPLSEFEAEALSKLYAGEDVVHRSTLNRIEMVGSIRTLNNCTQCHRTERGELMGAFSYELIRLPPVPK